MVGGGFPILQCGVFEGCAWRSDGRGVWAVCNNAGARLYRNGGLY